MNKYLVICIVGFMVGNLLGISATVTVISSRLSSVQQDVWAIDRKLSNLER